MGALAYEKEIIPFVLYQIIVTGYYSHNQKINTTNFSKFQQGYISRIPFFGGVKSPFLEG